MFHFINEETNMFKEVNNLLNVAKFINDGARDHTLHPLFTLISPVSWNG